MSMVRVAAGMFVLLLVATPALAHVPAFPTENDAPSRAVEVPDPTKSWAFYDRLDPGEVAYYRFSLAAGERLNVGTYAPNPGAFTPSMVVMSEAFAGTDGVPPGVEVPPGMGAVVVLGERPDRATFEPFTPAATYPTASLSQPVDADATYLVAVYEGANRSGPVGVVVGYRESFSPVEYLTVPLDRPAIHHWAGQSPLVVFGPTGLVLLAGALAVWRPRRDWDVVWPRYALSAAGLLIVASGVTTLVQLAIALDRTGLEPGALVTAALIAVPLATGGWALRVALRPQLALGSTTRIGLAVAGAAALLSWGGFIVGPVGLLLASVVPGRWLE